MFVFVQSKKKIVKKKKKKKRIKAAHLQILKK